MLRDRFAGLRLLITKLPRDWIRLAPALCPGLNQGGDAGGPIPHHKRWLAAQGPHQAVVDHHQAHIGAWAVGLHLHLPFRQGNRLGHGRHQRLGCCDVHRDAVTPLSGIGFHHTGPAHAFCCLEKLKHAALHGQHHGCWRWQPQLLEPLGCNRLRSGNPCADGGIGITAGGTNQPRCSTNAELQQRCFRA